MKIPFVDHHILSFLKITQGPLDLSLRNYFQSHKSLGAKDRKIIGNTVFGMTRWKSLLLEVSQDPLKQLEYYKNFEKSGFVTREKRPKHLQLGSSLFLFEKLISYYGEEKAEEICRVMNTQAPTVIRVNTGKISREELFERLKKKFSVSLSIESADGISFQQREPLFALEEFREGLFEVQDEGSQLVAALVEAGPQDLVLDYCSGSGGKALAIAPRMKGQGQLFLHDIRESALQQAKKRLKRAGVQNAQCLMGDHPQLKKLTGKCDWVLLDVPCSGSGTLRRNPDQKWQINQLMLDELIQKQRDIFHKGFKYVSKEGKLVYATCSLFPEENEEQVRYFEQSYPVEVVQMRNIEMKEHGSDGFFSVVFRKIEG